MWEEWREAWLWWEAKAAPPSRVVLLQGRVMVRAHLPSHFVLRIHPLTRAARWRAAARQAPRPRRRRHGVGGVDPNAGSTCRSTHTIACGVRGPHTAHKGGRRTVVLGFGQLAWPLPAAPAIAALLAALLPRPGRDDANLPPCPCGPTRGGAGPVAAHAAPLARAGRAAPRTLPPPTATPAGPRAGGRRGGRGGGVVGGGEERT